MLKAKAYYFKKARKVFSEIVLAIRGSVLLRAVVAINCTAVGMRGNLIKTLQ